MEAYKIVNVALGTCLSISGNVEDGLSQNQDLALSSYSGTETQLWGVDTSGDRTFLRSAVDPLCGIQANQNTSPVSCNVATVIGNEGNTAVVFVNNSDGSCYIKLASSNLYLTASTSATYPDVYWTALKGNNYQKWNKTLVSGHAMFILELPDGPRCNWSQKHSGVTAYFGTRACTLVAGLNAANIYATDGIGYSPANMNSSVYWGASGYKWVMPGQARFGAIKKSADYSEAELLAFIRDQINLGQPPLIDIGPNGDSSHTVVAYGYRKNAATTNDIYVFDPAHLPEREIEGRAVSLYNAMGYYNINYYNIRNVRSTYRA